MIHLAIGPIKAEFRLGRTAVGGVTSVEGAIPAIIIEVAAAGDHLDAECTVRFPVHFAEVGRLSRPDECLKGLVFGGAEDLQLEVAATGGAAGVVGGAAGGRLTGIGVRQDREGALQGAVAGHKFEILDHLEPVSAETAGVRVRNGCVGQGASVAEGGAASLALRGLQMPTGDVERGLRQEVISFLPQLSKGDAAGMAEEPSRLSVERGDPFVEAPDPKSDRKALAL